MGQGGRQGKRQMQIDNIWRSHAFWCYSQRNNPVDYEFMSVFGDQNGTKLQPTPENKPTSQITILAWEDYEKIAGLFGEAAIPQDGYKAQAWKKRNFMKSWRAGDWPATLESLEVHYNKNKMALHLKFNFVTGEYYE